ncbi:2-hydroxyacid dehydrogenase [Bosea sp. NBC_00550]|uniref:2-hydroxyacid dehydrogenase n=1 Tax=Bosea sp. NBC_00550 TaxID=2969621 RepID=UPI00222EB4EE|nr:NAD(P)-dependent oxidoreductase [Bosea sp. NBC_00550]UZF90878.1 NAD(P)-binding domain-containing protein [Bosea sp. NBC_00550]
MRAKYIDCGPNQLPLWRAALAGFNIEVDVNTEPFSVENLPSILEGYEICIDDHTRIPPEVLTRCTELRHFVYFGTGAASILDLALAAKMGIEVHTIRNYGDTTVAELAAGLVLAAARQIAPQHHLIRGGGWTKMQGIELRGRRIGLIGLGGIGREMARICAGIGLEVVAWNRSSVADPHAASIGLDELLATSDVVSLHMALNDDTRGFFDARKIAAMKRGALLVNTARGALLDEAALVQALESGQIGHAALDVFETEPLPEHHPLRTAPNVTLTAHCGFWTEASTINQVRLVMRIVEGIQSPLRRSA